MRQLFHCLFLFLILNTFWLGFTDPDPTAVSYFGIYISIGLFLTQLNTLIMDFIKETS